VQLNFHQPCQTRTVLGQGESTEQGGTGIGLVNERNAAGGIDGAARSVCRASVGAGSVFWLFDLKRCPQAPHFEIADKPDLPPIYPIYVQIADGK